MTTLAHLALLQAVSHSSSTYTHTHAHSHYGEHYGDAWYAAGAVLLLFLFIWCVFAIYASNDERS